tara:strand:+ start:198 stop:413 length:216 start_codon:yes stop_codon:yes gene_type:complete
MEVEGEKEKISTTNKRKRDEEEGGEIGEAACGKVAAVIRRRSRTRRPRPRARARSRVLPNCGESKHKYNNK